MTRWQKWALSAAVVSLVFAWSALCFIAGIAAASEEAGRPTVHFRGIPQEGAWIDPPPSECLVRVVGPGVYHYKVWREDWPTAMEGKSDRTRVVVP